MAIIPLVEMEVLYGPWSFISTADVVSYSLLMLDMVIKLFVEYVDKSTYVVVDSHMEIAMRYAAFSFAPDVLVAIPIGVVSFNFATLIKQYSLLCLIRLWRFKRVFDVFASGWQLLLALLVIFSAFVPPVEMVGIYAINRVACLFYVLPAYNDDPTNTWIGQVMRVGVDSRQLDLWPRYILCMYWSTTTFSTAGYGDLHPVNGVYYIYVVELRSLVLCD
ncbi:hypothetical protein SASPL_109784 [Salvia splendens]|uniref:Ion transport domain-containing protein n=1 Tax=Salvia splendens TaxID=180675 RepID=A0A8X8YKP1_SALSN|nr:hypothetical protein SASPL_109784 [Salvia splendens]